MLGGLRLQDDLDTIKDMLSVFWAHHQHVHVDVEMGEPPQQPKCTIPYFTHGDEGRGQAKQPILVVSFQPLMSWGDMESVNASKIHAQDYETSFYISHVPAW